MKSWGVRLGMAGVTLVLGLLAIAQAQRDRSVQSLGDLAADYPDQGPPKPIPGGEFPPGELWQAPPPPQLSVIRANNTGDASGPQVSQTTHTDSPGSSNLQFAMPGMSATLPAATPADAAPSLQPPSMSFPAGPHSEPSSAPLSLALPSMAAPSLMGAPGSEAGVPPSGAGPNNPPGLALPSMPAAPTPGPIAPLQSNASMAVGSGVGNSLPESTPTQPSARVNGLPVNGLRGNDESMANVSASPSDQQPTTSLQVIPQNLAPSLPVPPSLAADSTFDSPRQPSPPMRAVDILPSPEATMASNARSPAPDLSLMADDRTARSDSQRSNAYAQDRNSAPTISAAEPQPGEAELEGAQTPSILIQKKAPSEVKIGQPAIFVIHVRNTGTVTAHDVRVEDKVPRGMRLLDATPEPSRSTELLTWDLGAVEPGEERAINIRLVPEVEGELGSVARVSFQAAASVRTIATRPELRVKQMAPEQVLIGQQVEIDLEVSNPGTGSATGVVLQEDVPQGLEHPKGRQLDNHLGDLMPGETRRLTLRLMATEPGVVQNVVRVTSEEGIAIEDATEIEVTAPNLIVDLQGPARRFLERQANFEVSIANTGTAPATNIDLIAYLDRGVTFISTEFKGQYDANRHAVFWSLAELPPGQSGTVPLRLLPIEEGTRVVRLETKGDLGLRAESEKTISVEALAELSFSIADVNDPIEVGTETGYEIRVTNNGSRSDSNVRLQVELPPGLQLISSEPPAQSGSGRMISFAPLAHLDAKSEFSFRIKAKGASEGAHIVRAILTSDSSRVPVTKEESTLVYADQ